MFDIENNPDLFKQLHWQSDWNSEDVGYECDFVVGLYSYNDLYMYLNMETLEILEAWIEEGEE